MRIPIVARHNKSSLVLPSSGDSFPYFILKRWSQLGIVIHLLTFLSSYKELSLVVNLKELVIKLSFLKIIKFNT